MLIPINGAVTVTLTVFYDRLHRFPIHYWQMWYQKYISAHSRLTFRWKVLTEHISFGRHKNVNVYQWCCDFYLDSFFLTDICSLNIIYKYGIEKNMSAHSRLTFKQKILTQRISFWCNKNAYTYQWGCAQMSNERINSTCKQTYGWIPTFWYRSWAKQYKILLNYF